MPKPKEKTLKPVYPNAGIEAAYRKRLRKLIEEMNRSVAYWLKASYRKNEPEIMAADEVPAAELQKAINRLTKQWQKKFDEAAPKLAAHFAQSVKGRSDLALKKILKDAGFAIEFDQTRVMTDVMRATINQNVALIKSIPERYFTDVQGAVMRSVQTGRDLKSLTDEIEKTYGIARRRAAFIASDQTNKATSALSRVRRNELQLYEAEWVHSGGGKDKRPTHVKAGRDRVRYDIRKGWYDPAVKRFIHPGEEPGCKCVSRAVIKGFS